MSDRPPLKVLIAEDEPSIVTSIDFLMRQCGFQTRLAANGEDAMAAVGAFRPDLVILDLMLPRLSGLDVCRRIRGNPAWKATRVLMLTARGAAGDMQRGMDAGADDYVLKPFATQELVARVKALLGP